MFSLPQIRVDDFDESRAAETRIVSAVDGFDRQVAQAAEAPAMTEGSNHLPLETPGYNSATAHAFKKMGYDVSAGLLTAIPRRGFDVAQHPLHPASTTPPRPPTTPQNAAALNVMDAFMAAFDAPNAGTWANTLLYPHVRFESGKVTLYPDRAAVASMRWIAGEGWDHSGTSSSAARWCRSPIRTSRKLF